MKAIELIGTRFIVDADTSRRLIEALCEVALAVNKEDVEVWHVHTSTLVFEKAARPSTLHYLLHHSQPQRADTPQEESNEIRE